MPQAVIVPVVKSESSAQAETVGRGLVGTFARWGMALLGGAIVVLGIVIAPLPGPFGVPIMVIGLMILLRSSFSAKRAFVKLQRRHPRFVFPLRRLLRREPEVLPVAWQQMLRFERMVVPRSWRFARRLRLSFRKKPQA
jgi:Putative transmembrane protein (PGPGW)